MSLTAVNTSTTLENQLQNEGVEFVVTSLEGDLSDALNGSCDSCGLCGCGKCSK